MNNSILKFLFLFLIISTQVFAEAKKNELSNLAVTETEKKANEKKADDSPDKAIEYHNKIKYHKYLGLVTAGLMIGAAATAEEHKIPSVHKNLGVLTAASYFTTAYFSLSAPEIGNAGANEKWNITAHKYLALVHFPAMILTPIAGIIAANQIEKGEKVHGLGKYKEPLAGILLGSFIPAALLMTFEF